MHDARTAGLTIGALARAADVGVETVRYYQRRGLLEEPQRPLGGIRRYGPEAVAWLRFIRHAQALGFSLEEVGDLLTLDAGSECEEARTLAEAKLSTVRTRLRHLRQIEKVLVAQVRACRHSGSPQRCPLIETLASGDSTAIEADAPR